MSYSKQTDNIHKPLSNKELEDLLNSDDFLIFEELPEPNFVNNETDNLVIRDCDKIVPYQPNENDYISLIPEDPERIILEIKSNDSIQSNNRLLSECFDITEPITDLISNDNMVANNIPTISIEVEYEPERPSDVLEQGIATLEEESSHSNGLQNVTDLIFEEDSNVNNIMAIDDEAQNEQDTLHQQFAISEKESSHCSVPSNDNRMKNKKLREMGSEYKGLAQDVTGKYALTAIRSKRVMLPICNSNVCKNTKERFCYEFAETDRKKIFSQFWDMSWDMRKVYVSTLVKIKKPERSTNDNSKRVITLKYHLRKDAIDLQVCKKTFLNTLALKEWMVRNWCLKSECGMHKDTSIQKTPTRKRITAEKQASLEFLKKFLDKLPKLESHYCRSSSTKLYLEPIFQTKMELYRFYQKHCEEEGRDAVTSTRFQSEMHVMKISISSPKKDQCDVCIGFKVGNVEETAYHVHVRKKNEARQEKERDKAMAKANPHEFAVWTMDMQAVKLAPVLHASAIYFKTKLCVHNFTIFDLMSKDCYCYLWHEGEGGLEASIFCTILSKHLDEYLNKNPKTKTIVLYSDGCGYQNRNKWLSNMLYDYAKRKQIIIMQKYLEKGHTQMEVDGAHSLIERKLKNRDIHLPSDYVRFCQEARMSHPFIVKFITHDFFLDFTNFDFYSSIRPGCRRNDPHITDIRCLKYEESGIDYKLDYTGTWEHLPQTIKKGASQDTPTPVSLPLYKKPIKIKKEKFEHLQTLKAVLHKDVHPFYDSLAHY